MSRALLVYAAATVLSAAPAGAAQPSASNWQACTALAADSAARLACFDQWASQQAAPAAPVAATTPPASASTWVQAGVAIPPPPTEGEGDDPEDRQQMLTWTSQLLPPEVQGSHIASGRSQITLRWHDVNFRAATAVFGHLGIEWDLAEASQQELADLADWIQWWKLNRDVLLGGRAAEQVEFDQVSTGASNDLSRATDIIRRMITDYGMSGRFRNVALSQHGAGYGSGDPKLVRDYAALAGGSPP